MVIETPANISLFTGLDRRRDRQTLLHFYSSPHCPARLLPLSNPTQFFSLHPFTNKLTLIRKNDNDSNIPWRSHETPHHYNIVNKICYESRNESRRPAQLFRDMITTYDAPGSGSLTASAASWCENGGRTRSERMR